MRRLLCWVGLHRWKQSRPLNLEDIFPFSDLYDNPTRVCDRCGMRQAWLPGYGGSELGCWLTEGR